MALHEKVFVDKYWLIDDPVHGSIACIQCHGGDPEDGDWRTAHEDVYRDPSWDNLDASCGMCHQETARTFTTSLHATLNAYVVAVDARASTDPLIINQVHTGRDNHCMNCHASCGQCHVSRPATVDSGLLASHYFQKRPPMKETCAACHGSRIDKEYFGKNEGMQADVHQKKYMRCEACHSGDEMHGDGNVYESRYEVENRAQCISCHDGIYGTEGENVSQHVMHQDQLSCQVCHALPYKNCYTCHVGKDIFDLPYFKTDPSEMGFKIGLNPLQSEDRPETYVTVRHVPVDQGLFDYYVEDGLANFDSVPTWKLATPHTIARNTPQNESCGSCHGNRELFLQESDVRPEYLEANKSVIVPDDRVPMSFGG